MSTSSEPKLSKRTLLANLVVGSDDGTGESSMLELLDIESLYVLSDSIIVVRMKTPHPIESWGGEQIYGKPLSKEQRELLRSFFE